MAASPLIRVDGIERMAGLDPLVDGIASAAQGIPDDAQAALRGTWLGHPLHPALTDLPIGFWTSAWVLDLVGGRRCAPAATALVGLGVASAVPTMAAGLADWVEMPREKQRVGVVHATCNLAATAAYTASFLARCRGRRGRGILWGFVGAGIATAGGYLGGHLAFGTEEDAAGSWADVMVEGPSSAAVAGA